MKKIQGNDLGLLVEQCQQINIDDFVFKAKQKMKEEFIKCALEIDDYDVELTTSKLSHGGLRYWFKCPLCSQRVGKLYKHPFNQKLACRKCNNLEYKCRRYKGMIETRIIDDKKIDYYKN